MAQEAGPPPAFDLERALRELTLDEQASLTAGLDLWHTVAIPRLGITSVAVTDGPSGARGPVAPGQSAPPSLSVPCGSALGATWDPELLERVGAALARDARAKGCHVLLAPTVNLHRSPLAGRTFECYSEDPELTGALAASFIRGAQAHGVVTTVKHFAGNEAEFERQSISSVIDERALRELYLRPFEVAVTDGRTLGVMTAYNRVNGVFMADHEELVARVLRGEWGFDGIVLTDWFASGSTAGAAAASVDLEMPGPGRFYGPALAAAVEAGEVSPAAVHAQVRRLLGTLDHVGAFDQADPPSPSAPDRERDRALAREAASASFVLLANDGILPISPGPISPGPISPGSSGTGSVAVIGPNAGRAQIMGGGSASLRPWHRTSPLAAITERLPAGSVVHARGCDIDRAPPTIDAESLRSRSGEPGLDVEFFADPDFGGPVVAVETWADARSLMLGEPVPGIGTDYSLRATAELTPKESGMHRLALVQSGRARVLVDGTVVVDGTSGDFPRGGDDFFGLASHPIEADVELVADRPVRLTIEYSSRDSGGLGAVRVGCHVPGDDARLLAQAEAAAAAADVVILVVGTNDDYETEGRDRGDLALPGAQDELVARVLAANPRTVVVVNSGAPVTMEWANDAAAVLQVWLGGQEMAHALADTLFGLTDPGGRLPVTIPCRLEDTPAFGNFPGEHGEVRYGEGLLVGYRWYDTRLIEPRFPFGHGLSYTSISIEPPRCSTEVLAPGHRLVVDVDLVNDGARRGSEVVQCYVVPGGAGRSFRPRQELKAFAKVTLDPGERRTVSLALDARAFSVWDPGARGWRIEEEHFELAIGRSSVAIEHRAPITVAPPGAAAS